MDETGLNGRYDLYTAAAWILGHARNAGTPELPESLRGLTAGECREEELSDISFFRSLSPFGAALLNWLSA